MTTMSDQEDEKQVSEQLQQKWDHMTSLREQEDKIEADE